jgi:8-oxo-dGTP diphosphatase/2-hydroxy-dATP diphosphatase
MKRKLLTLSLISKDGKILLGMKKRGFGQGRWNGFGGKVLEGETIEEAAKRELREEVGILAKKLEKRGILRFTFDNLPNELLEVHVFHVLDFEGEPLESEEMKPQWFKIDEIPFDEMWPDDKHWLPLFLKQRKFEGSFHFRNHDILESYTLFEIQEA